LISLGFIVLFYWRIHKKKQEQNNGNNTAATNDNNDVGPMKPHQNSVSASTDNAISSSAPDINSPFNSPSHNDVNVTTGGDDGRDDGSGFADALDHPITSSTNDNQATDHKDTEEDVVFK
jgi:hypothetical protein